MLLVSCQIQLGQIGLPDRNPAVGVVAVLQSLVEAVLICPASARSGDVLLTKLGTGAGASFIAKSRVS
jgi:hypothetical protein